MSIPRKSVLGEPVDDPELEQMLDQLPVRDLSEEELTRQRESFVYGNSRESSEVTKDSARHAANSVLI